MVHTCQCGREWLQVPPGLVPESYQRRIAEAEARRPPCLSAPAAMAREPAGGPPLETVAISLDRLSGATWTLFLHAIAEAEAEWRVIQGRDEDP